MAASHLLNGLRLSPDGSLLALFADAAVGVWGEVALPRTARWGDEAEAFRGDASEKDRLDEPRDDVAALFPVSPAAACCGDLALLGDAAA